MKIVTARRLGLFWRLAQSWFIVQFSVIRSILGKTTDSASAQTIFGRLMQIYAAVTSAEYGTPAIISEMRAYSAKESTVVSAKNEIIAAMPQEASESEIDSMFE